MFKAHTDTAIDLFVDLETLTTADPVAIARIVAGVTCPANYTKAETIAAWEAEKKPALILEAVDKTALDGAWGRIGVIGWAYDDEEPTVFTAVDNNVDVDGINVNNFDGPFTEAGLLDDFFSHVSFAVGDRPVRIVGHNVAGFDIRFLMHRAIVLGVKIPKWLPINPKPWDATIFDTMVQWAGPRDRVSLDTLCTALGIPGKDGFDGSMVAAAWAAGEYARIADYCADDVRRARAVARRIEAVLSKPGMIGEGDFSFAPATRVAPASA
jgi:hypothetical protein